MTLIGAAATLTPYLIHAVQRAGTRGLGRRGGCFRLWAVEQETELGGDCWQPIYAAESPTLQPAETLAMPPAPAPAVLQLRLRTPLRLERNGRYSTLAIWIHVRCSAP
jgi:hypothetical protein